MPIIFKHLHLNRKTNQSQLTGQLSMGQGNDGFFGVSVSHDRDGHHVHICYNNRKSSLEPKSQSPRGLECSTGALGSS